MLIFLCAIFFFFLKKKSFSFFRIVITIKLLAEYIGCYKITLDCKDKMIKFYKQFGFVCETGNNNMMTIRFKD